MFRIRGLARETTIALIGDVYYVCPAIFFLINPKTTDFKRNVDRTRIYEYTHPMQLAL